MLRSKLHCQKGLKLKPFFYKIVLNPDRPEGTPDACEVSKRSIFPKELVSDLCAVSNLNPNPQTPTVWRR